MSAEKTPLDGTVRSAEMNEHGISDEQVERSIRRKMDFRVVPMLWILFLVSFVDRSNIANAKIQGMTEELHMKGNDYNIAVMLFTLAYIISGPVSTIVFRWAATKRLGTRSISVMMVFWGIIALCQGFVHTPAQMKALRFILGTFESGFVPGCAYVIGSYYQRDQFVKRYAFFFSASILAGAFNGLLSSLLVMADGAGGLSGWRWIFVIEGVITVCFGIFSIFVIIPLPEQNPDLTARQKDLIASWSEGDPDEKGEDRFTIALAAFRDIKTWLAILIYLGAEEVASGVAAFQPTVLKGLGFSSTEAQVRSIPIYMTAWAVLLVVAFISDATKMRCPFVIMGCVLTLVGSAIEISQPSANIRYMGMFFIATGSYLTMAITVVWMSINVKQGYKRAAALGMLTPFGNCGALISSNVFITSQSPRYHTGFSVGLVMCVLSLISAAALYVYLRWENAKMDRKDEERDQENAGIDPRNVVGRKTEADSGGFVHGHRPRYAL